MAVLEKNLETAENKCGVLFQPCEFNFSSVFRRKSVLIADVEDVGWKERQK